MFSQKSVKLKGGRCVVMMLMLCLLVMAVLWPQLTFDIIIADRRLIQFKYMTNRTKFLCADMHGGVGNLLYQYTFAYSMAKRYNHTLVCDPNQMQQLQLLFNVPDCPQHSLGYRVCFGLFRTSIHVDTGYDKAIERIDFKNDIHFEGYFQSWKYWEKYEEVFQKDFTIRKELKEKADEILTQKLQKLGYSSRSEVTLVGIHIRRGDMLEDYFYNYGYNVVSEEYVTQAKKYIRARVKGPIIYIVCSNDLEWTQRMLSDSKAVFIEGNSREVDFAVLSACDHFIMSVGTFGWWIGWHVKGIVTFYTKPFRPATGLAAVFADDYLTSFFYPGWIGIS